MVVLRITHTLSCVFLHFYISLAFCFNPEFKQFVYQTVTGNGFHRVLNYSVKIQPPIGDTCMFAIKQKFPVNLYIDLDELENLRSFQGPHVVADSVFDVEKPSFFAEEHVALIHANQIERSSAKICFQVLLPIHVRYQRPVASGYLAAITMEIGKLYTNCTVMAAKEEAFPHGYFSASNNDGLTNWFFLRDFSKANGELSIKIPTGNTDHAFVITFMTIGVTAIASFFVLKSIMR